MNKKKLVGLLITTSLISATMAQADQSDLARVKKMNGIEVYVMAEPLIDYEVAFDLGGLTDLKSNIKAKSLLTGGLVTENVSDKLNQLVNRANEKASKNHHEIDAVIYSNAKTAVAVRFTTEGTPETQGISRVSKLKGKRVFVYSEPLLDYDVINEKKGKAQKGTSLVTAGLVNSSIEEDIQKLVDKLTKDATKKGHRIDGIIYSSGKSGIGIKLYQ